jgi:amidase
MGVQEAEPAYRNATELVDAMAGGEVSAVELAEDAIARIERFDPTLNAVCVPDFERALDAARAADAARARGGARPLLGVPMTVKESFHMAGLPTTWGIPEFKDFVPDADALAVERVKAAGAVVLGKTNVPLVLGDMQSYNAIYGTTRNPWDPERTPGVRRAGRPLRWRRGTGRSPSARTSAVPCATRRTTAASTPTSPRSGCSRCAGTWHLGCLCCRSRATWR